MNEFSEYLPIGTVLLLKGAQKKVMITGHSPIDMERKDRIYGYLGCIFPEGIIKSDENILFNAKDIDKIFFKGYVDEEQEDYLKDLNDILRNEEKIKEIINNVD